MARSGAEGGRVRAGEELDAAAVDSWLRGRVPGLSGVPEVTQYSGGASNWTYRLKYPGHDLILRRPPAGTKAKSAHDMGREFRVQQALKPVFPYVPEMIAHCEDPGVIGAEFYVMSRIDGVIPRARWGEGVSREAARELSVRFVETMVLLHQVDGNRPGLKELGKGPGYARRQIEGWADRYQKARTWNVPRFTGVIEWLRANTPEDVATCVVHNDFRFDNLVLDPSDLSRVVGVLDWEMATLGDPLMDLGNSLAYWVQANDDFIGRATRRQPTHLPGMLTRKELVAMYTQRMGLEVRNWEFYEIYGLFRLSGIAQQIYYRYHHRQTRNPAFRFFWVLVHYLHWRCGRSMRAANRRS